MQRHKTRGRVLTGLLSLALLGAGASGFWWLSQGRSVTAEPRQEASGVPLVEAVVARTAAQPPMIAQTGFLQPYREVEVAFEVQGRISAVAEAFEIGNAVEAGTVLARIDAERYAAAVRQTEADLTAAEARAAEAEQEFRRQAELESRGVAAEQSLEQVRASRATARAQVEVARSRLEVVRIDLRSAEVRAPFEAYVTDRSASEGQLVTPGQPIGVLVRADLGRLVVGLADRQVRAIGDVGRLIGTEVAIRRAAGQGEVMRTGRVVDVEARIDRATRTTNLVVDVPDPFAAPPIRLGELVETRIPLRTERELVEVPAGAVKDGRLVWEIGEDGTLAAREVTVVLRSEDAAFLSGADALIGARLMMTDLAGATDGTRVRIAGEGGAPTEVRDTSTGAGEPEEEGR